MGFAESLGGLFKTSNIKLTSIPRSYFMQSVTLLNICREIQLHCQTEPTETDHKRILEDVEHALRSATDAQLSGGSADEAFDNAAASLTDFCSKNEILVDPNFRIKLARKDDNMKEDHLFSVKRIVKEKIEKIKSMKRIKISITIWPEKVFDHLSSEWTSNMTEFEIEEAVSLNCLLLKIHASYSLEHKHSLSHFSLAQNPQFFSKFPYKLSDFPETKDKHELSSSPIYPLDFFKPVVAVSRPNKPINLIVDRSKSLAEEETALFKREAQRITQEYRNIWTLESPSDKPCFAAREKFTGALVLLQPQSRAKTTHSALSSSTTLVDRGSDSAMTHVSSSGNPFSITRSKKVDTTPPKVSAPSNPRGHRKHLEKFENNSRTLAMDRQRLQMIEVKEGSSGFVGWVKKTFWV